MYFVYRAVFEGLLCHNCSFITVLDVTEGGIESWRFSRHQSKAENRPVLARAVRLP